MNYYEMLNRVAFQNAMAKKASIGGCVGFGAYTGLKDMYDKDIKTMKDQNVAEKDRPSYGDWAKRNQNLIKEYDKATSDARLGSYIGGGATMAGVTGLAGLAGNQIPWLRNRKFLKWLLAGGIGAASAIPVAHYVGKANAQSALQGSEVQGKFDAARAKDTEENAKKDAEEAAKNKEGGK